MIRLLYGMSIFDGLSQVADESVHCIVTSIPYWGLRNYGTTPQIWPDGWRGELGQEPTPELYVQHVVSCFRPCHRVLRKDGTLWLNMGDTYCASPKGSMAGQDKSSLTSTKTQEHSPAMGIDKRTPGLKPKDLVGIPWMVAFALRGDGWWLRQEIIWHKPNPMPESVSDRCTKSHESIFLFAKSDRYFYDNTAIAEPAVYADSGRESVPRGGFSGKGCAMPGREPFRAITQIRNRRSVWTIPTVPYPEAHYAVFPPTLPQLCIMAGTSERGCCPTCGAPWERVVVPHGSAPVSHKGSSFDKGKTATHQAERASSAERHGKQTLGWQPTCSCSPEQGKGLQPLEPIPCTVLDPFAGSGTTLMVAKQLGRSAIGIDLDPQNEALARQRLSSVSESLGL